MQNLGNDTLPNLSEKFHQLVAFDCAGVNFWIEYQQTLLESFLKTHEADDLATRVKFLAAHQELMDFYQSLSQ